MDDQLKNLMTLDKAAESLGIAAVTLRAAIARSRFAARKFGTTWVTTKDEVERYRRDNLGQVGRPPESVIEIHDRVGFNVRVTLKVNPSEIAHATALVWDAMHRAMKVDETFDPAQFWLPGEDGFVLDDLFLDQIGQVFTATVRRRATMGAYPPLLADDERTSVRQEIVPPTREPGR